MDLDEIPCNIFYGVQMKEKIYFTGLLLKKNHECITTNLKESVLHCKGNIPVPLQPKSLRICPLALKVMLTL
jgi:hypothetical protein